MLQDPAPGESDGDEVLTPICVATSVGQEVTSPGIAPNSTATDPPSDEHPGILDLSDEAIAIFIGLAKF